MIEPTPTTLQRFLPAALASIGVGALVVAYSAEIVYGLKACNLCIAQRVPYVAIAVIGWTGLRRPRWISSGNLAAAASFVFLIGGIIAIYHVGVEQNLWESATNCGGKVGQIFTVETLQAALELEPPKACDDIDWTFLGVSMATYNAFLSLVLAGITFNTARRIWVTS
ncbi:MAG: hypothetical protein CBB68_14195 [Rhodospirillaceae bacterium TMED8]|nr:disulfide bond formation protein B [Magnetovibrio sp.]OUT48111.1 MAG: hypothetical protein CBB68_14195 [Rhodospirillaceae bacterium TMED8]|tara:strand:- start:74 stop:577 length:504 start_codon:yes stop_codon:yes gene_type:complete